MKRLVLMFLVILLSGCIGVRDETPSVLQNTSSTRARIMIDTLGEFEFNPNEVVTVREDIFVDGQFSIFDILVYLDNDGSIDMEYRFDEEINTHVVESINGKEGWWYMAYYSGGWSENNVFRMDHYPYKESTYIRIIEEDAGMLEEMYGVFREEIDRKEQNNGKVIIPRVIIDGPRTNLRLNDVEVTAHNLRDDVFQPGTITAIDVIMSLAEQGKLTYDLQWYDSIGRARVVRSYWVSRIDNDASHGRCGFVYEAGSSTYSGFRGNHIHIPADTRVINSPEYEEWFWICL